MPEPVSRSNLASTLPQTGRAATLDSVVAEVWRIAENLGADGAAVYTVGADGALWRLAAFGNGMSLALRRPPPGWAKSQKSSWPAGTGEDRVRWLSLQSADGAIGWLAVALRSTPNTLGGDAFQAALNDLASALEGRRVEDELQRARLQMQLLYQVTHLAHPPTVGPETFLAIARALVEDAFLAAAIYRFDEGRLICEARDMAFGEDGRDTDLTQLENLARRSILTRSTQTELAPGASSGTQRDDVLRMAVPLLRDGLSLGALAVEAAAVEWSEQDARLLEALAEPITITMENIGPRARLYSRLHEKAAYAEEELETVVREALAGLVVLDDEWRILRLNPAACAILDCEIENVLGQSFVDVVKDARVVEDLAALVSAESREGHRPMIEARLDGTRCDVLMGIARLGPGYLVSLSDITALKDVDRLKSEIIANVSHEFRAPLASIKAYTELLLQPGIAADDTTRQHFLDIIGEETDYLTDLITNMLDLSRLQSGHLQMAYTWLDVRRLVGDVINMLAAQAEARQITFEIEGGQDEPLVWADRQLMIIVLKNLIGNAVKYNRVGGRVTISIAANADEVTLRVRDEGIGIPPSAMPQLFEKFYRVVSTTESGIQGTGLGLALTKAAVDAHDGSVSVTSREGSGTEFAVTLPNRGPAAPQSVELVSR